MESHPSHGELSQLVEKYPQTAGSLFQTYNDLKLAQQWEDLQILDLPACSRGAFKGRRPKTTDMLLVVPCSLAESLSISWFDEAFKQLGKPSQIYLAINAEDSNIVYYKISPGIIKPPV
ncbi:tRNA intron endonuclease [Irpex rosettiformis]|uniref:tRNA intron endonuclease n=1 Tax=Irpex rosettiformis TaxID=378272 RepID=A0ACB8U0Y9_9APHY|nr:tRNA intron endonuclease [Irpex rosettiformis]